MNLALANSVIALSVVFAGCLLGNILVTLYLIAGASCLGAGLPWWQFRRAMRESGTIGAGERRDKPSAVQHPRSRPAKNLADSPVTADAVSRPVPAGSYVRETPQSVPQAARPGKEMS